MNITAFGSPLVFLALRVVVFLVAAAIVSTKARGARGLLWSGVVVLLAGAALPLATQMVALLTSMPSSSGNGLMVLGSTAGSVLSIVGTLLLIVAVGRGRVQPQSSAPWVGTPSGPTFGAPTGPAPVAASWPGSAAPGVPGHSPQPGAQFPGFSGQPDQPDAAAPRPSGPPDRSGVPSAQPQPFPDPHRPFGQG